MPALSELRSRLELQLSVPSGDAYVGSATELQDINEAYRKTAYTWDWPQFLVRRGRRILANQRKYPNPANFRKFHSLWVLGQKYEETELHNVLKMARSFGVDLETGEFFISSVPGTNGTEFTNTNAEAAGQTVTIELNSVAGLSAGDEIVYPDDGNPEVTFVAAVATASITARLATSKSINAVMYKGVDNIMFNYYRLITALSLAGDTPLLPADVHLSMLYYAAYLAYTRLEQYDNAERCLKYWKEQIEDYWRAFDKGSTGLVSQFTIG